MNLVQRLVALEEDVKYQELAAPGQPEFVYQAGPLPLLLSAPHGAVHTRRGGTKDEDNYTAALARLVAELTGTHVLYARRKSLSDPNWDSDAPYKACLAEAVQRDRIGFILDLHGSAPRRSFGLALGTLSGRSCPVQRPAIIRALEAAGFKPAGYGLSRLDIDHTFTANGLAGQETVTRYAWDVLHVPAAQIEINEQLRAAGPRSDASGTEFCLASPGHIAQTVAALVAVVQAIAR